MSSFNSPIVTGFHKLVGIMPITNEPTINLTRDYLIIMNLRNLIFVAIFLSIEVNADSSTVDAAIGGGIGGAAGAAIGNEVGGRDGAIVGSAIGAAVGTAVNTDDKPQRSSRPPEVRYESGPPRGGHPRSYHCPPGQRKKGRC